MTRIELSKKGIITDEVKEVVRLEPVTAETLSEDIAKGLSVIPRNIKHNIKPIAIGRGLRTKVNANIGTSKDKADFDDEIKKLHILIEYGADALMDLSTGGRIKELRRAILNESPISFGTVPIYEAVLRAVQSYGSIRNMSPDNIFQVIEEHGEDGVDFVTVHSGVTRKAVERLKSEGRLLDVVSRGGAFLIEWMILNDRENPLYEDFGRLLELAKRYDMTLSLGDGMRPGCIHDATDRSQLEELITISELRDIAVKEGIQVIVEGPGHVPLNQVELNIKLQKELCKGAPFYVLGPLVTDIAMGYDHIAGAIGGAIAAGAGADFLCYVTPSEHVRLPDLEDVKEGLIASKIAAHAGDIAKGIPSAIEKDKQMAIHRKALNWEGQISISFNPEKVKALRASVPLLDNEVCSMCGEFCAIRTVERALKGGH